MADARLSRQIALLESGERRAINNEYANELLVRNTDTIRLQQVRQMGMQADASAVALRAMAEVACRLDTGNEFLREMAADIGALLLEAERMVSLLQKIDDTIQRGFAAVQETLQQGFGMLAGVLERAVTILEQQQSTLNRIADTLSAPYDTRARELLREGQKWLQMGAQWSNAWRIGKMRFACSAQCWKTTSAGRTMSRGSTLASYAGNISTTRRRPSKRSSTHSVQRPRARSLAHQEPSPHGGNAVSTGTLRERLRDGPSCARRPTRIRNPVQQGTLLCERPTQGRDGEIARRMYRIAASHDSDDVRRGGFQRMNALLLWFGRPPPRSGERESVERIDACKTDIANDRRRSA